MSISDKRVKELAEKFVNIADTELLLDAIESVTKELRTALAESKHDTEARVQAGQVEMRDDLQKGHDMVASSISHVSHGGPTIMEAGAWLDKVERGSLSQAATPTDALDRALAKARAEALRSASFEEWLDANAESLADRWKEVQSARDQRLAKLKAEAEGREGCR